MNVATPLAGRRIVTTRDQPGELDRLLVQAGADVVHVPLIEIVDVEGHEADVLNRVVSGIDQFDWLIVTSRHGAARLGSAAAASVDLRLASVGTGTAAVLAELAGRPVDVVPERQTAVDLVAAMPAPDGPTSVLVAQADRAEPTLVDGLRRLGFEVTEVVVYRTVLRHPTDQQRADMLSADCVAFASGSAAIAWATTVGIDLPRCVVAIGPTTAAVAARQRLEVTHVAADHSIAGLVAAITEAVSARP